MLFLFVSFAFCSYMLVCMLSLHFYSGPQNISVLTIRENGISTYTSPQSTRYSPLNLSQRNQFSFGRSQSFKNYHRCRQNVDNERRNGSDNYDCHTPSNIQKYDQRGIALRNGIGLLDHSDSCVLHHQHYIRLQQPIDNSSMR